MGSTTSNENTNTEVTNNKPQQPIANSDINKTDKEQEYEKLKLKINDIRDQIIKSDEELKNIKNKIKEICKETNEQKTGGNKKSKQKKSRKQKKSKQKKSKKLKKGKNRMSKIYLWNGKIKNLNLLYKGKPFFRKMTNSIEERKIYSILKEHQNDINYNQNIVKIYRIDNSDNYVDIELLDVDKNIDFNDNKNLFINFKDNKNLLLDLKSYLQKLGIVYIDWKPDQFGVDSNNIIKIFDFNASGIIDTKTKKWINWASPMWSFNKAFDEQKLRDPIEIDDYIFNNIFIKEIS